MTEEELSNNLKFPSSCIDKSRTKSDLGRFGLGLKTASFFNLENSQCFQEKRQ